MSQQESKLFPALLRYWRQKRGLSQLDLALSADVSARHVSFLETGRASPSKEMIFTLAGALNVPLREQNALLLAAGFPEAFVEEPSDSLPPLIERVLQRMFQQQEPYPMVVMDRTYDVIRSNEAATRLLSGFLVEPPTEKLNIMRMLFDPKQARSFIVDWEKVAKLLLSRLHRESLMRPSHALSELSSRLLSYPGVPESFRSPDLSGVSDPVVSFRLKRGDIEIGFITTVTVFDAPQNLTLSELHVESYFPLDEKTARYCEALARTQ
jgi:transcriptional regulator with XRE-family HTH domain